MPANQPKTSQSGRGRNDGAYNEPNRGNRPSPQTGRRDPSDRTTAKPDTTLENTSQTAILRTCADTLYETFTYCIQNGIDDIEVADLGCFIDAADLCTTTANFVARGSEHAQDLMETCASIVKCCEELCEDSEDQRLAACADVCRECCEHLGLPTQDDDAEGSDASDDEDSDR